MHYTECVVNLQKHFLNNHTLLFRMRLESIKKRRPYLNSKVYIIRQAASIQKISANSDRRNDMHAEKLYAAGVRRVSFIANEQGRL